MLTCVSLSCYCGLLSAYRLSYRRINLYHYYSDDKQIAQEPRHWPCDVQARYDYSRLQAQRSRVRRSHTEAPTEQQAGATNNQKKTRIVNYAFNVLTRGTLRITLTVHCE